MFKRECMGSISEGLSKPDDLLLTQLPVSISVKLLNQISTSLLVNMSQENIKLALTAVTFSVINCMSKDCSPNYYICKTPKK